MAHRVVQAAGSGKVDVDADEVHELERAHREAGVADRLVDARDRGDARLEEVQRLQGEWPIHPVDDEARAVAADDRRLAPHPHQRDRPVNDGGVAERGADHLNERHARRRIEEMQADDPTLMRNGTRAGADRFDRDGAGVRREGSIGRRAAQLLEDAPLYRKVLERSLDDEAGACCQGLDICGRPESLEFPLGDRRGSTGREAVADAPFRQAIADPCSSAVEGS